MTTFDDREKSEEAKFKHDQEVYFRVRNRRNKLFGQEIAGMLGLEGEAVDAYAKDVVMADFERPGDGDVLAKVVADLGARSGDVDEVGLRRRLDALEHEAKTQIMAE